MILAAAKRFGVRAVGVDIDPQRIVEARVNARRNGLENLVELRREDGKGIDLSSATVVTLFLDIKGNLAPARKLRDELCPGSDYWIPGWPHDGSKRFKPSPPYNHYALPLAHPRGRFAVGGVGCESDERAWVR